MTVVSWKADADLEIAGYAQWELKVCVARVRVKLWRRGNKEARQYTLLSIVPPDHVDPQTTTPD